MTMKRLSPALVLVLALGCGLEGPALAGTLRPEGSSEDGTVQAIVRDHGFDPALVAGGGRERLGDRDFTPAIVVLYRPLVGEAPSSRPRRSADPASIPSEDADDVASATINAASGSLAVVLDEFDAAWFMGAGPVSLSLPAEESIRQLRSVADPIGPDGLVGHPGLADIELSALAFEEIFEGHVPLGRPEPGHLSDALPLSLILGLAFAGIAVAGILARRRWRPGPGGQKRHRRHASRRRKHRPTP